MKYRTVNLDAFSIIGMKEFTSVENGVNFTNIPQMRSRLPEETLV
jgi:predicted transcriptional regulator YdeE